MNLAHNQIGSKIPPISSLHNLQTFDISYNRFFGSTPRALYDARTLTYLDISNNFLAGNFSSLNSDPSYLDISNNAFTGTADFLAGLSSVTYLNISHNNFADTLPDLSQKVNLVTVDLSHNSLTDTIHPIYSLSKLQVKSLLSEWRKLMFVDVWSKFERVEWPCTWFNQAATDNNIQRLS